MQASSRIVARALGSIVTVMLVAAPAVAGPGVRSEGPRRGGTFGVSLGAGHIGCEDSDGNDCSGSGDLPAGSLSLRAGAMMGPGSSLAVELWGMRHSDDGSSVSQGILAGVARGWLAPRLWVQGGLGVARVNSEYDSGLGTFMSESDVVPAAIAGVGVEILSTSELAVDLELQGGAGLYRDDIRVFNVAFGAGVSFY